MVSIEFPCGYVYHNLLYGDSNKFRHKVFKWSRDEKQNIKRNFSDARHKLFAWYLSQGTDIYLAFELVFSKYKSRNKMEQILGMILENKAFQNYLKDTGIMASIQQEMKAQGLNNELLVKKLKKIIESDTASALLQKYAIETAITFQERISVNITDEKSNPIKRNINDVLKDKVIGQLSTGTDD